MGRGPSKKRSAWSRPLPLWCAVIDDRALETARLEERRAIVRYLLAYVETWPDDSRARVLRLLRNIEACAHWERP